MQIGVETSRAVENKRVLVVHLDEIFRAALQFMLHDENEAHEVATLQDAYAMSANRKVDLVLLVAKDPNDPLAQACLASGANDILTHPLRVEPVRRKANALLGRAASPVSLKVL